MELDPRTGYVDIDGYSLAYQVLEGAPGAHAVWYQDLAQHLDLVWTDPTISSGFAELSQGLTSVLLQQRGVGLSPAVEHVPTIERQAADALAVMDAVGVRRATVVGTSTTCAAACLLAAQHPERVAALVLLQPVVQGPLVDDLDARYWTADQASVMLDLAQELSGTWGKGGSLKVWDPALDTPFNRRLMAMIERCSIAPGTFEAWMDLYVRTDCRELLEQVRVPTLVLRVANNAFPESVVRGVAELIPGAVYEVLPSSVLGDAIGDAWARVFEHVLTATTGSAAKQAPDRVLASVLFTDIVGSTEHLARLGDGAWRAVVREHELLTRREVAGEGGRIIRFAGDGAFSTFPGPAAAVRCASAICNGVRALGVEIRAGVHTGECEPLRDDLAGMAVHVGARVSAAANPSEVLVSRAVRDLVTGSGLTFTARGAHELKGIPDRWELFALGDHDAPPTRIAVEAAPAVGDRVVMTVARSTPGLLRGLARVGNAWQRRRHRTATRQAVGAAR